MTAPTPFIDVDGHIAEPPSLWQDYIEPNYRDRTLRILEDEGGLEFLSIDGTASWFGRGGTLGALCAIGQDATPFLTPGKVSWADALIPGGYDPHARIEVMNAEGIDKTLIYPSLGLLWEADCKDPQLAAATCRAYNNWVFDFCRPHPDRLIPVTHIPTLDVAEGVRELARTARLGSKAAMISAATPMRRPLGGSYFDPLWRQAQELDMPITIHPASGSEYLPTYLYPERDDLTTWWVFMYAGEHTKMQFSTLFNGGTFEKFPRLKVVVLESGTGWLVSWLERMDEKFAINGFTTPMKRKPSEYFQSNCWIAMDPDDVTAEFNIERLGSERFLWAYDYPHSDSITEPVSKLKDTLARLPPEDRNRVIGGNAVSLYNLTA